MTNLLKSAPAKPLGHLILTHGAMAAMDSPFMDAMTEALVARSISVTRFEFAYMAQRRTGGKKRPPPRAENLLDEYRQAVAQVRSKTRSKMPLAISGKSLGGRVASMVAQDLFDVGSIAGLVCLGYPFHPVGKPEQLRTAHLENLTCPALILQGERDPFGTPQEIADYDLSPEIQFHWVGDGDHDFGPRGRSGYTRKGNLAAAADAIAAFIVSLKKN